MEIVVSLLISRIGTNLPDLPRAFTNKLQNKCLLHAKPDQAGDALSL